MVRDDKLAQQLATVPLSADAAWVRGDQVRWEAKRKQAEIDVDESDGDTAAAAITQIKQEDF